ncbi:MAG TPA: hypothetical protein VFU02_15550 [Polyangiaceae bacterium]|nr:hypothetical protein [Polyangiaceae bacterium]
MHRSALLTFGLLIASISACSKENGTSPPEVRAAVPASAATAPPLPVPEGVPAGPLQPAARPAGEARLQREQPINAAPLGLEIGYANLAGARAQLASLEAAGTNEYTRGPMYRSSESLGIDGLRQVLLIFAPDESLQAVAMTFAKDPKGAFPLLAQKYRVVENRIDGFMNRGTARLEKGESWIRIDAPHLSFEMEILYISKDLQAKFEQSSARKQEDQRQHKAGQL